VDTEGTPPSQTSEPARELLVGQPGPPPDPDLYPTHTPKRGFNPERKTGLMVAVAVVVVVVVVAALVILIPRYGDADKTKATAKPTTGATAAGSFAQGAGAAGPLIVLAHRGGFEKYPHETLPALVSAAQAGEAVETDVQWTSDNVPILMHEDVTTAAGKANADVPMVCTGGPYVIAKTTWSVLKSHCKTIALAAKDGTRYPIATLDDAMKNIAAVPGARIFAEVKVEHQTVAQTALFLSIIEKYGMAKRAVVTSFFPDALARVRTQGEADGVAIDLMRFVQPTNGQLPSVSELAGEHLYAVAIRFNGVTRPYVSALKAKKLVVIDWTVNTKAQWATAKAAGVTTVLTDLPDTYRAALG
jgi:glycerophosphoryl diester phosphodiesterase